MANVKCDFRVCWLVRWRHKCRRCGAVVWSRLSDYHRRCDAPDAEPQRTLLGDWIAARLKALGWQECPGCSDRRELLNRWHARLLLRSRRWL